MAFASRLGNALRRTSAAHSNSSLFQAVRCMSSSKLFVAGLSFATDESSLKNAFSHYGDVLEARVITDRDSGRSRGFGFVTYSTTEAAAAAVTAMDGQMLQGRTLKVDYANDRAGGIRGGGGSCSASFTSGNGYFTGGYGSTGGHDGGYGNGHGSGVGRYESHSGGYDCSGAYNDRVTGGAFASNCNNAPDGTGGYASSTGYSDASSSAGYQSSYNNTYRGGYDGGNGGYSGGTTSGEYARSYNNVPGGTGGYASSAGYSDASSSAGYESRYNNNTYRGGYDGGNGGYSGGTTSFGYARSYNNVPGRGYADSNSGYSGGTGYVTNYDNTYGGKYAGGTPGYGDGTTGGYATNNDASHTDYNSSSGVYRSSGRYTASHSDGNTGGHNAPNTRTYGATDRGAVGDYSRAFSRGDSGFAGLNNDNNFAGNVTGGSYNRSTRSGGLSGDKSMGFETNKVQYNGQDDLLGDDFFDDKEGVENL